MILETILHILGVLCLAPLLFMGVVLFIAWLVVAKELWGWTLTP